VAIERCAYAYLLVYRCFECFTTITSDFILKLAKLIFRYRKRRRRTCTGRDVVCSIWSPSPPIDHLSWGGCLEVRGEIIRTVVLYFVLKLCTLRWAVLTVLWIWFCHTGPISLCIDWFICVYLCVVRVFVSYCIVVELLWAWWSEPDGIEEQSFGPVFLQCFDTVGWVISRLRFWTNNRSQRLSRTTYTRFPTSLRRSSYVAPNSPKGGLRNANRRFSL